MWTCSNCNRVFQKVNQPHSCQKVSLKSHFEHKQTAKEIFDFLLQQIEKNIGKFQVISLPCCIHLFGSYDFLAAIPKKEGLEIRIGLPKKLNTPRLRSAIAVSSKAVKNCFDLDSIRQVDSELLNWIKESYHLKD